MGQRNILYPSVLVKSRGGGGGVSPLSHANPSAVTYAKSKASRLFGVDIITELRGWSSDSGLRFQFIAVPANTSLYHIFQNFSNLFPVQNIGILRRSQNICQASTFLFHITLQCLKLKMRDFLLPSQNMYQNTCLV